MAKREPSIKRLHKTVKQPSIKRYDKYTSKDTHKGPVYTKDGGKKPAGNGRK